MGINNTAIAIKKKLSMKNISNVIMVILSILIVLGVLAVANLAVTYVHGFVSNTGTEDVGGVKIIYSSASEKIQAICLCTVYLTSMVIGMVGDVLLWGLFNQIASKNKPFLPGQANRLQKIAFLLMIQALLDAFCNTWALVLSAQAMHGIVLIWPFVTYLGLGMIEPLIFFCMAVIFNYGMGLQTESDETL